jgi:hypothetical protein
MVTRKSTVFLSALGVGVCSLVLVCVHASWKRTGDLPYIQERAAMVERYGLTDLCLFTDARYTRNPAVADHATPFQDHPVSFEHFPSGSIVGPPPRVRHGLD